MRILTATAIMAALAGPAGAQGLNILQDKPPLTEEEKQKIEDTDRAYRAARQKIPEQKTPADPWGNVRNATSPQTPPARTR